MMKNLVSENLQVLLPVHQLSTQPYVQPFRESDSLSLPDPKEFTIQALLILSVFLHPLWISGLPSQSDRPSPASPPSSDR